MTTSLPDIFATALGDYIAQKDEHLYHCPFCHHHNKKLSINFTKRVWKCWVCGMAGRHLYSLAKKLNFNKEQMDELRELLKDEYIYPKSQDEVTVLRLPEEFHPLWIPEKSYDYKNALSYLKRRGITAGDIIRYRMGYCTSGQYANRIIIPSYDEKGELNYFVGRDFFDVSKLKYKNPPVSKDVVGLEYHINWNYPIVLCEGIMDAIAIKWNAIPLFGKTVSPALRKMIYDKAVKEIYIALDSDAKSDAIRLAETFIKNGLTVHLVELEGKDPSEIGFEQVQRAIETAKTITFKDLLQMKLV